MANIKLDFSKMKHVHSDDHFTTLRHATDGHTIKLAHKSLSPENQSALQALSGIAKQAQQSDDADEMKHKMAEGGFLDNLESAAKSVGDKIKQAVGAPGVQQEDISKQKFLQTSSNDAQPQAKAEGGTVKAAFGFGGPDLSNNPTTEELTGAGVSIRQGDPRIKTGVTYDNLTDSERGRVDAYRQSQSPQPSPTPQAQAEGGSIEKERSLNYADFKKESRSLPKGPSSTLNYPALKKEYTEKNRKPLAEGGHPGETCPMCGGGRANYADPKAPVSSDDIPPNLDPNQPAHDISSLTNFTPSGNPADKASTMDTKKQATEQIYNRMLTPPTDVSARVGSAGADNDLAFGPKGQSPAQFSPDNWNKAKAEQAKQEKTNADGIAGQQQLIASQNAARVDAGQPTIPMPNIPQGPQVPGSPANPPQPSTINPTGAPIQDGPPQDMGMSDAITMSNSGYLQSQVGIEGMGAAQSNLATQQAKIQDTYAKADTNVLAQYQKSAGEISGEMDAVRNDIANNYITPEQYWTGDKDGNGSHSKIASAIGMILAGFNPTNKPNAAIDFLKNQMEMNLQAQVHEMGKKQNVLTSYQNKFKNMRDSMDFARLTNAQVAQAQLAQAASKAAGGPNGIAAMQAQQAIGKLNMDYAPIQQRMNMSQAMMKMATSPSGNPDVDVAQATKMARFATAMGDATTAKQWQEATVPGVGVTSNLSPVSADVRSKLIAHQTLAQAATQLQSFIQSHGGLLDRMSPNERAQAAAMVLPVQAAFREGTLGTVYREGEQPLLDKAIKGQPLDLVSYFINTEPTKIKTMLDTNEQQSNILKKAYSLPVRQPQQPAQAQTKTVNGITYKRGPNGEAIPVK